ncbi:MAG: glucose 1-dehydrogenase [Thermoplasmata archaeon]
MRAIVAEPPKPGAALAEMPDPPRPPGGVLVRVLECGLCGTDRDIVSGKYGVPPAGESKLILGHENLGRVVEVDPDLAGFAVGDLVVATVRRGCGLCRFCRSGRSDYCETGRFTERGINGRNGYLAELYGEVPDYLVKVPPALRSHAVLLEPLSVVEKAIHEGTAVLDRLEPTPGFPRDRPRRALVTGTGAIGMLAALVLASEGFDVVATDRHDDTTPAAALLARAGILHINSASGPGALGDRRFELVVEASGSPVLDFELLGLLARNGAIVLTGIPAADVPSFPVAGGSLLRAMVLENQVVLGSVNSSRGFFEQGIAHLGAFRTRWGDLAERLITERRPVDAFAEPLSEKSGTTIKMVLTLPGAGP